VSENLERFADWDEDTVEVERLEDKKNEEWRRNPPKKVD
jgi:hypothetical protein